MAKDSRNHHFWSPPWNWCSYWRVSSELAHLTRFRQGQFSRLLLNIISRTTPTAPHALQFVRANYHLVPCAQGGAPGSAGQSGLESQVAKLPDAFVLHVASVLRAMAGAPHACDEKAQVSYLCLAVCGAKPGCDCASAVDPGGLSVTMHARRQRRWSPCRLS